MQVTQKLVEGSFVAMRQINVKVLIDTLLSRIGPLQKLIWT
jgi:hypothetical protein